MHYHEIRSQETQNGEAHSDGDEIHHDVNSICLIEFAYKLGKSSEIAKFKESSSNRPNRRLQ